jgi:hypothetical protein
MESFCDDYTTAMKWLNNHQHPPSLEGNMNIVILSHPRGDGDGLATRIGRLVGRIVPHILKGDIVILEGGFRGYTHPEIGLESLFEPFSNIKKGNDGKYTLSNVNNSFVWKKNTPLFSKGQKWWYGVILNYFMRPNPDLERYIDLKMERLNISSDKKYIGLHVRRGDNSIGLKYNFEDYYGILTKEIIPFWRENKSTPLIPKVYLATDSSEILTKFSDKKCVDFEMTFEKTISLDISHPGQSTANIMIRNEKNIKAVQVIGYEVIADIIILSRSVFLMGIMTSQITKVAAAMAHVRGNIIHTPIALDYDLRIEWVKSNNSELYNGDVTPFVRSKN